MNREKLEQLQAVVFDMDGLMFDSERVVKISWDKAGEILGYGPLGHNIVNTLGTNRTNREIYFKKQYGQDFPFDEFLTIYRNAYYEYSENHGVPVKEGLHELLEVLREKNMKIGVATSSSAEHAWANLKREHIEDYFQTVITGDMVHQGKPEPDIYLKACEGLKALPETAMALEDAVNGIRSAYKAGMMPVMIPDLVKDTSQIDELLFGKYRSLLDVAGELKHLEKKER